MSPASLMRLAPMAALLAVLGACGIPSSIPGSAADVPPAPDPFETPDNWVPGDGDAPGFAVTSVDPVAGPANGGTRVEVKGAGFLAGSTVVFGASEGLEVVVQNDGSLKATTPPHPPGLVDVIVRRPDGKTTRLEGAFLFETEVAVDGVEPPSGPAVGGTPVTVLGRGFLDGTRLVIGGRLALDAHVLDETRIVAVTPPGIAGPRDVLVLNPVGNGVLKKGFTYVEAPRIDACEPPVVVVGEPVAIRIVGEALAGASLITTSAGPASLAAVQDAQALRVDVTPQAVGPATVTVATPGGVASLPGCFRVEDAASLYASDLAVLGVVAPRGPAAGGYGRAVVASGLAGAKDVSVRFGGHAAEVTSVDAAAYAIRVVVPAGAPGTVDVSVTADGVARTLPAAYEYLADVSLASIAPAGGPAAGGTEVVVAGLGLDRVAALRIGPLPATVLSKDSTTLRARTSPANPGLHDVVAVTDTGATIVLPGAFTFGADLPDLIAITPATGAIAGGTLVSIVGSGFSPEVEVRIGGRLAAIEDGADPARLRVRTPQGDPGQADVVVRWPGGTKRTLARAFTYFDPTGYFGGLWGDVVDGAVNVTVLDNDNGKPVPFAFVVLGADLSSPWRGMTNLQGQVTLSGDDLFGPVDVTATRADYSTFTFAGFDAENVTLYIDPLVPSSSSGGSSSTTSNTLRTGIVSGRALGLDKFLLAPPASCADRPLVHGPLCRPCAGGDDCGSADEARCTDAGGHGRFCATVCAAAADCPDGYDCYPVGGGAQGCLPSPGRVVVRCGTSTVSAYSYETEPGPGAVAGDDGVFAVNSRLGDVAIHCTAGFVPAGGTFTPVVMGLRRHVTVNPYDYQKGLDIALDIPVDRELRVRFLNAPGGPGGPNRHDLTPVVDLGSDGVLRLWPDGYGIDADRFVLRNLPRTWEGPFEDARMDFTGDAYSNSGDTTPYSTSVVRGWRPGKGARVLRAADGGTALLDDMPGVDPTGGCALPGGGGLALGPGGIAWSVSADGAMTLLPSPADRTLRACAADGSGRTIAVGDGGLAVLWDGTSSGVEAVPASTSLHAVAWTADGTAWVAGPGVLLRRAPDGTWSVVDYGSAATLRAVVGGPGDSALLVGDGGIAVLAGGGVATQVTPWPAATDLEAACAYGPGLLVVGVEGAAFVADWTGAFSAIPTGSSADLYAVAALPDGTAVAAGSDGAFLRNTGGAWEVLPGPAVSGDVVVLFPGGDSSAVGLTRESVTVGPFLGIPIFSSPPDNGLWDGAALAWTLDGPTAPSMSYSRLSGTKGGGTWKIVARGDLRRIALPDLFLATGIEPLTDSQVRLHHVQMLVDDFVFESFDDTALYMSTWRSWSVVESMFDRL